MKEFTFPKRRICPQCPDLVFATLDEHADHLATHNASPAQWADAYKIIQQSRERAKKREAAESKE
jgi:hypothetical protein